VIVVDGTVRASLGSETTAYGPGTALGALESIAFEPREFTVVAHTDVRGLRLEARVLLDLIEDSPGLGSKLLRSIAHGLGGN
jgi:CRP-like cAMP-binding protein